MTEHPGRDDKPLYQALIDAQKLAFAPLSFHAALALRDLGILETLAKFMPNGSRSSCVCRFMA